MWSLKTNRSFGGMAAVVAFGLMMSGCQVHPLYAPDGITQTGQTVSPSDLRSVQISGGSAELTFLLYGGEEPLPPKYYLRIVYTTQSTDLGIRQFSGVPAASLVSGTATFTLTNLKGDDVLLEGTSTASASYDVSSQSFANLRARKNAYGRAEKAVAQDIRIRVAVALAEHKTK